MIVGPMVGGYLATEKGWSWGKAFVAGVGAELGTWAAIALAIVGVAAAVGAGAVAAEATLGIPRRRR